MGVETLPPDKLISIHALRVEGDGASIMSNTKSFYFYPRPPGGGRPRQKTYIEHIVAISIHALRVEGDKILPAPSICPKRFLSTPSGWRATRSTSRLRSTLIDFYPRPPGGGRQPNMNEEIELIKFLSTPSGWRATAKTDKVFICFCAKRRRICLFKTRKERICRWRFKKDKFWVLIWCEGSGKSVCALASHCG